MKNSSVLIVLVLLTLLYFLPGIVSPRDFWVEDEARYAEVLREMTEYGQWIVPHLNGEFYPDKPPIYFWLSAISSRVVGGISPFSFMIITWLSTLGSVILIYYFGKELFNQRAGVFSALIFMSTFLVIICGQIVRMDMLLTFFVMWALYVFYLGLKRQNPWYYVLFYLFSGLAVLTKGPFGFSFTFLPAIGFLIHKKNWTELKRFIINWGFILFFAIISGWLGIAWMTGHQDFVINLFVKQIAGRAVNSFSHKEPFYFYLLLLPLVMLPWFFFLPSAIAHVNRIAKDALHLLVWWFITGFITISLVSGKLFIYLLPFVPATSLMLGALFNDLFLRNIRYYKTTFTFGLLGVILTFGIFAIVPFFVQKFPVVADLNIFFLTYTFIPLTIAGVIFCITRKIRRIAATLFIGMWIFSVYAVQHIAPKLNPMFSARAIGNEIEAVEEAGFDIASYKVRPGILNFYAETIIPALSTEELENYFDEQKRMLVMKTKHYKQKEGFWGERITHVSNYEIANEHYVLITN